MFRQYMYKESIRREQNLNFERAIKQIPISVLCMRQLYNADIEGSDISRRTVVLKAEVRG